MMFPMAHGVAGAAGGIPYAADGIRFDKETPDYATRGADLTGAVNSKLFSGSFWFKRITTGSNQTIYEITDHGDCIDWRSSNILRVRGFDTGSTADLEIETSAITDTASWHHAMFSVDMADTGKRHLYIDGASDLTIITYVNDTLDFTSSDHAIGARNDGGRPLDNCIADLWIAPGQYIDLSVAGNRAKFYNAGSPVNLGADGSAPTGTAPLMFFSGAVASWHTNKGSGGGFTEQGTFADCASDP